MSRASIRGNTALAHVYDYDAKTTSELIENIIPIGQRRSLTELTEQTCHWPIGDPGSSDFIFCGAIPSPACLIALTIAASPIGRRLVAAGSGTR
jgi:GcrA cell cycle regulator